MKTLENEAEYEEIRLRLTRLNREAKPLWGRMNANQMLCHLRDSYLASMGGKKVSPATGLFQRTVMKWGALYFPMPWPQNIPTRPEVEQGRGGTAPAGFDADRSSLLAVIADFRAPDRNFAPYRHPIFGRMSRQEWMRWGYLHADHHLRQFGVA